MASAAAGPVWTRIGDEVQRYKSASYNIEFQENGSEVKAIGIYKPSSHVKTVRKIVVECGGNTKNLKSWGSFEEQVRLVKQQVSESKFRVEHDSDPDPITKIQYIARIVLMLADD